jgi:predicted nuclease of predicted toxin-antitoxin system
MSRFQQRLQSRCAGWGVDVVTAQEDGHDATLDPIILDRAGELGRVIFSRDDDFLREATRRLKAGEPFGGVVYSHQLALSVGECVRDLHLIAVASEPEEYRNRVVYLPL